MVDTPLRERRQALLKRTDLRGNAFCTAYAAAADEWLSGLADRASGGNIRHLALLAVGGYGRGGLCPFSDLDVVLVHDGRRDVASVADAIWYPVWDQGVHLDHSVRRPKEVLEAATDDLRVALGLLDARLVWGDARVAEPLLEDAILVWRSRLGARWLPTLGAQMEERRHAQGDVAFLLEPDLKEAYGGLRDVNVLQAIAAYAPLLADYVDLASIEPAAAVLTAVRVELHRSAGRELNRLLLQEQDHVAAVLEYADADQLMAAVSEAGRTIGWVSEDAWRRQRFWAPAPPPRGWFHRRHHAAEPPEVGASTGARAEGVEVEPGVEIVGGEVALTPGAAVAEDSSLPLRLAAVSAEQGLPIARGSLARLADKMAPPPDPWPVETLEALVRVLATGPPAITALESLDRQDLLSQLLPEWQTVRNKPQRNAYHRFTVDRHLLETAANAAALTGRVERPDLLLLGAVLHDIGKGSPGDHTEAGMAIVGRIGRRMGLPEADVETLVTMVRLHLLLPDTATRRDLGDPTTIDTVANAVGDRETLLLLACLTEADSMATGPSAWGPWKAGLVADLVARTAARLEGKAVTSTRSRLIHLHRQLMEEVRHGDGPRVELDPPRVVVAAPDRPGLLASATGVLALHGLNVRSADARSEEGVAVEEFTVEAGPRAWPDSTRLREDLEAVLAGRLPLEERLAARAEAYAGGQRASSAHAIDRHVRVDNSASATSTVLEIRAPDELGLLHRVTEALFDCGLDVVSARVSTIGSEVVDAFYVRGADGAKLTDQHQLEVLKDAIMAAVD